jgi:hypothetical protein
MLVDICLVSIKFYTLGYNLELLVKDFNTIKLNSN